MKKVATIALTFAIIQSALAQSSFLCISDASTGFGYDQATRKWVAKRFNVDDHKFLLNKKDGSWQWTKFGETYVTGKCSGDFNSNGFLDCEGFGEEIRLNKQTLRFQSIYNVGYVVAGLVKDDNGNTPYIEIGRCSPM